MDLDRQEVLDALGIDDETFEQIIQRTNHNPSRLLNHADLNTRIQHYIDMHRLGQVVRWEYTLGGTAAPPDNVQAGDTVPVLQIFLGIKNGLLGQPSETAEYIWFILTVEFNPTDEVLDRAMAVALQTLQQQKADLLRLNNGGMKGFQKP
jgi:hypothetical protein